MRTLQRIFNDLFIFVLCVVLLASDWIQFVEGEEPCSLCLLQRLGMIGVASSLVMNLRFGIKVQHYGLAILSALLGRIVSLRQIGLHVCPEFPTFGEPIFGLDLYVWAFLVFTSSILACAILLVFFGYSKRQEYPPTWGFFEQLAFGLLLLITLGNVIATLLHCDLTSCID